MSFVRTVNGDIAPEELGFTQCHEHLMITRGRSCEVNPDLLIDDEARSLAEVKDFCSLVITPHCSIVDAQPQNCNGDALALQRISQASGVNIIASTGFHKLAFYYNDSPFIRADERELTERFIADLTEGIAKKPVRAGMIKTALDTCGLEGHYLTAFRAALNAKKNTHCPLMVHIEKGSDPVMLADYIHASGIQDSNIYFCHMDRACDDSETLYKVLDRGISLEFDTIGRFKYHSDAEEIAILRDLIDRGYEDMLAFSLDTTRRRLISYDSSAVGLSYILKTFIPEMLDAGLDCSVIRKISIINPSRLLAWE